MSRLGLSHSSVEYCTVRVRNLRHAVVVSERLYQHAFFAYGRLSKQAAEAKHRFDLDQKNLARWQQRLSEAA